MKRLLTFLFFTVILLSSTLYAQIPPNAFNYSAVARDASGQAIATSTIGIQISILQSSTTGTSVYTENHFVNTDEFGLFNLVIGAGAVQSGSMTTIDWAGDNYYLKVGMDATGGTNFLTMGTTQLLSVPYALHSATADSIVGGVNTFSGDYLDLSNQPTTVDSISSTGDTLYLSNGQTFVSGGNSGGTGGSFTHYIGEEFGGGVIFHLWKDAQGLEHGLIVSLEDQSISQAWSDVTTGVGSTAQSSWDGLSNSNAIVGQVGHTNSAAQLCLDFQGGGYNDWYLPAIDEIAILWNNRYQVNRSLSLINNASQIPVNAWYWSSSEETDDPDEAMLIGWQSNSWDTQGISWDLKNYAYRVRAIRAF